MLEDSLAERTMTHAVLMDVLGLGVLIAGESGIGKSECALDLIVRGHRLVADDTVEVRRRQETILIGACPELTRYHMELRGLGVINIMELFGIASTRSSKRVELVVQLERWVPTREYERLGLDDAFYEILGLRVPLIRRCRSRPAATSPSSSRSRRGTSCFASAAITRRADSPIASTRSAAPGEPPSPDEEDEEIELGGPLMKRQKPPAQARGRRPRPRVRRTRAGAQRRDERRAAVAPFIVLTGLSGSGKSQAIRALEDLGYFCVDNLPTTLIPTLAKLSLRAGGDIEKVAIVVDVREGGFLSSFPKIFRQLAEDAAG